MNRKDFRPNDESSSSSNSTSKSYELNPQYDSRASFYGKAKVRTENGKLILRSYNTDVAYIEDEHAVVTNTQSPTTVRHVKEFLKQNGYKADSKGQIEKDYGTLHGYNGEEYNKHTGQYETKSEIREHQKTQSKLKENTHVEITSKDFHGVKGTIFGKPEYDKHDKEYYYTVYNDNRNSGLGLVTNVRVKDLKIID